MRLIHFLSTLCVNTILTLNNIKSNIILNFLLNKIEGIKEYKLCIMQRIFKRLLYQNNIRLKSLKYIHILFKKKKKKTQRLHYTENEYSKRRKILAT